MFIGFSERFVFVREDMFENITFAPLSPIPMFLVLHSLRKSEIDYPIVISVNDSTAVVTGVHEAYGYWDVAYGIRNSTSNTVTFSDFLSPGKTETIMLYFVMNDLNSEDNETFTLKVSSDDVRHDFYCYDDGETPVEGNYFCSCTTTIIDDEDGMF